MVIYCPRCENTALKGLELPQTTPKTVNKILVEQCPQCQGLFFDDQKAEGAVGTSHPIRSLTGAKQRPLICPHCQQSSKDPWCHFCESPIGLICPKCRNRMELFEIFGVELDFCQHCDALWFDKGELEKIKHRYQRRANQATDETESITCTYCGKQNLTTVERTKTKGGFCCKTCLPSRPQSSSSSIPDTHRHENVASSIIDTWITLNIVDAIFELFSDS